MRKIIEGILIALAVMLLLAAVAAAGVFGFWLPYDNAVSGFAEDKNVTMYLQEDGSVEINWPLCENADLYLIELVDPVTGETEYSSYVEDKTSCVLPELPQKLRTLRITTVCEYHFLFEKTSRLRLGENAIEITDTFVSPQIIGVSGVPCPDSDQFEITLDMAEGCTVQLYKLDDAGNPVPANTFVGNNLTLSFGEEQLWPLPAYDEIYSFAFDALRQGKGYTYYGPMSQTITLNRQELLGTDLALNAEDNGDNTFTLSWNETKGDYYEFQYRLNDRKEWSTVLNVSAQEERSYTTATMKAYTSGEYRVIAWNNAGEMIAESEIVPVKLGAAIAYSTMWPIMDLEVYTDTAKTQVIGTAKKGTAFCILQVRDGMFRIRFGNEYGYIDSNYCLVNLPECMGDLCNYNIANSYASVFKIHEYPIPEITDTVIVGYENVMLEENQYLVPLLYPAIAKLELAAQAAKKLGYTLKIYDAYRPQVATQMLYDVTVTYAENNLVPPEPPQPDSETENAEPIPEPPETEGPVTPWPEMTFAEFMSNNGKYKMNYFVAKGTSRHNRGAALDLTLENKEGEVLMQTSIHDLSWYSEIAQNNDGAKLLAKIMKEAGFGDLVSEWWHFQDDDVLNDLKPPALDVGVNPECWMADENGWRYRRIDGKYLVNCTKTIDGVKYKFDKKGYATLA